MTLPLIWRFWLALAALAVIFAVAVWRAPVIDEAHHCTISTINGACQ